MYEISLHAIGYRSYDDIYEIFLSCTRGERTVEASCSKSVAHYFDENGYLCRDIYEGEFLKLHSSLLHDKKVK